MRKTPLICLIVLGLHSAAVCAAKPLDYVPADTPYLFANEQGATAEQLQAMQLGVSGMSLPQTVQQLRSARAEMAGVLATLEQAATADADAQESAAEERTEEPAPEPEPPGVQGLRRTVAFLDQMIEEFSAMQQWTDMSNLGLEADGLGVLYGIGLVPVVRMELGDLPRFRAFVERLAGAAEVELQQSGSARQPVWVWPLDRAELIIAISDGHVVMSILPQSSSTQARKLLLAKPAKALGHAGLKAFNRREALLGFLSGYVNFAKLSERITSSPGRLEREFVDKLDMQWPELSDECRTQWRAIAGIAPQLSMGFTRFDPRGIDARGVLHLRPDLLAALRPLSSSAPPLEQQTGLFSMTVAVDPLKAIEFMQARVAAVAEEPFTCPDLLKLNADIAELGQRLAQVPPALLIGLQGMALSLDQMEFDESSNPTHVGLTAAIRSLQPAMLLGLLQMSVPQIGQSGLSDDGQSVTIGDLELGILGKLSLLQTGQMLAGGTGPQAPQRLSSLAERSAVEDAPWFSARLTGGFYTALRDVLQWLQHIDAGIQTQDVAELQPMLEAIAQELDHVDVRVMLGVDGVEFYQKAVMQD